jgi:tRNA splicing endonuclease
MSKDELKEKILELLKNRDLTSIQIRDLLLEQGLEFNFLTFREALAELVREGKVEKYPVYEEKKFYFRSKKNSQ